MTINNKEKNKNHVSCRRSCLLFDTITEKCSIKDGVNVDSPYEVLRCYHFINKNETDSDFDSSDDYIDLEHSEWIDDDDIFYEFIGGSRINEENSKYPHEPDFPSKREDAYWYVSPEKDFGCWIINKYKKPMLIPRSIEEAEKGWSWKVYKSPIPLHNHNTSLSLASKMAWYIDKDGYGQYVLLANGKISTISSPKPSFWK